MTVGVGLINFNTAAQTLRCLESLRHCGRSGLRIAILDNASEADDFKQLLAGSADWPVEQLTALRSEVNLGFAAGCNHLFDLLLKDESIDFVLLLNNDAVALPGLVDLLEEPLANSSKVGMSGGRMHRLAKPDEADSLGITLYASLMASNRLLVEEPFLGPTGGCCMVTRSFVEDMRAATGHVFDPDFFCYWEDTDLVLRANLLGYSPAYVDRLVALHEGQASTGGRFNDFIAYHGLRNAIWTFIKCVPASFMLRYGLLFLLANAMSTVRYILIGKGVMVWRVYRDAMRGIPRCWRQRRSIIAARRCEVGELRRKISPRFYQNGYIAGVLRTMLGMGNRR